MEYKPHNYQAYCIERVVNDPAVGLFLRPGLGKTSITLSAINILKYFMQHGTVTQPRKMEEGNPMTEKELLQSYYDEEMDRKYAASGNQLMTFPKKGYESERHMAKKKRPHC